MPMKSDSEQEILGALLDLDAAVKQSAGGQGKPDFMGLFSRIDALARRLPPGSDPELLHFLHKKSYEKARLLLQGRAVEGGPERCS